MGNMFIFNNILYIYLLISYIMNGINIILPLAFVSLCLILFLERCIKFQVKIKIEKSVILFQIQT